MKNNKIIIAIDGYSSTGKSTIAKQLANKLGYVYVDTGAMYRAVALFALQQKYISETHFNTNDLINSLSQITISFIFNADVNFAEVYLNEINVEKEIRTMYVSSFVSRVAEVKEVREFLVAQQQIIGLSKGVVMDGRDIGTVVFPEAELKLFMTASAQVRAQRRYDELIEKGDNVTFKEVLQNVEERDYVDTHRAVSPLVKANDAFEIDNSSLSKAAQFEKIMDLVALKTAKN